MGADIGEVPAENLTPARPVAAARCKTSPASGGGGSEADEGAGPCAESALWPAPSHPSVVPLPRLRGGFRVARNRRTRGAFKPLRGSLGVEPGYDDRGLSADGPTEARRGAGRARPGAAVRRHARPVHDPRPRALLRGGQRRLLRLDRAHARGVDRAQCVRGLPAHRRGRPADRGVAAPGAGDRRGRDPAAGRLPDPLAARRLHDEVLVVRAPAAVRYRGSGRLCGAERRRRDRAAAPEDHRLRPRSGRAGARRERALPARPGDHGGQRRAGRRDAGAAHPVRPDAGVHGGADGPGADLRPGQRRLPAAHRSAPGGGPHAGRSPAGGDRTGLRRPVAQRDAGQAAAYRSRRQRHAAADAGR